MAADLYDLYARFGIASETAQVLEVEAGNLALACLTVFVRPGEVTAEETEVFRIVVEDVNRKPLGALFRQVKRLIEIDPVSMATLEKALDRRNYLTHHFFRTHNFAIQSTAGRQSMNEDLSAISADLQQGHQILCTITNSVNQLAGHDKDLNQTVERLIQRGKRVDI